MSSPKRGRVPGIRTLLALMAMTLAVPLLVVALSEVRTADRRVDAAHQVVANSEHLSTILRVTPAVNVERDATIAVLGASELREDIAVFAIETIGVDFDANLATARADVDATWEGHVAQELIEPLADLRASVDDGSISIAEADERYDGMLAGLADAADEQTSSVYSAAAAGDAADDALIAAARVAEATVAVEIEQVGQGGLWARLVVPFGDPTVADIRALSDSLARLEAASAQVDRLVDPDSATGILWTDVDRVTQASSHSAHFDNAVDESVEGGSQEPADLDPSFFENFDPSGIASFFGTFDPGRLEVGEFDLATVLPAVAEIGEHAEIDARVIADLAAVVDAALQEVELQARRIESDAFAARDSTIVWLVAILAVLFVGCAMLSLLVARPFERLARLISAMRDGDLDGRLEEKGPRELRIAARTMNEAIASLKLVEAQAAALADERLSDPILRTSTPGLLGASMQAAVGRLTTSLTEREDFQRRLAHEASHDGLTRIPNRTAVLRHVTAALARTSRSSSTMALLFIDIDGFKAFNDAQGHHVGDTILRRTAQRLIGAVREGDLAGRLGGDEFVVVAESLDGIDGALVLSDRIIDVATQPILVEGVTINPSVSIGIALADGKGLTADELLRDADLAVYRAKELGRGRVEVCDEELRGHVVERSNLESAIADGLRKDEFILHFQPTVDARTRAVTSLEALVRWQRPGHDLVSPAGFIEVAERTDLILDLDRSVMSAAVAQMAAWGEHEVLGRLPVAVNVSGRHLSAGTLVADVSSVLAEHPGVAADRLVVEITETALLRDLDQAASDLAALRRMGVRVALDDFGTGYMSLATLRHLPVDVLKIDRSFIAQMQSARDHSLVELMVNTGHLLGVDVTAEGVETPEQVALLTELGSDHLQGFLFSYPVDAPELERQLDGVDPDESLTRSSTSAPGPN